MTVVYRKCFPVSMVFVMGLLIACVTGCTLANDPINKVSVGRRTPCAVTFVMDGDTLSCDLNHNGRSDKPTEHIRLLGVDAPETHNSAKARHRQHAERAVDEPHAQEAKAWLTQRTLGQTVWLGWDVKPTDRYGRSLAWIYTSPNAPVSLNQQLAEAGLAAALFLGPNRQFERNIQQAEQHAYQGQRGIWKPE
ncbi:MAG: thermonuclease family protein [Vampirovibrionales bacterium]|nr:thermonuclease family protein [Vampirovibrionales bacterium]